MRPVWPNLFSKLAVVRLAKRRLTLDGKISLAKAAAEGNIALQAAHQGHPKVVQLLLKHGASALELDRYQQTALYRVLRLDLQK